MSLFPTVNCEIKRTIDGYTDQDTGQWVEGGLNLIAAVEADIQPKSGRERATELQTEYESDYKAFIVDKDITFEAGYSEIQKGDIFIDSEGTDYTIVFPGDWKNHYELELKEQ
jgi:endonuclease/exonuclease/phosphatase family metal-dependent hydrolase